MHITKLAEATLQFNRAVKLLATDPRKVQSSRRADGS
jgi:hypothetical protein